MLDVRCSNHFFDHLVRYSVARPSVRPSLASEEYHRERITEKEQLDEIIQQSETLPIIIYKHSTRCGLSSMTQNMLDRDWAKLRNHTKLYFLDLIRYRDISNQVEEKFNVRHQSPQILIIKNGNCIYNESHYNINVDEILENL